MKNHCEIIGVLSAIEIRENKHKLIFTMEKTIEVPINAISVKKLKELQGQTVGILNIDGEYRVRIISK